MTVRDILILPDKRLRLVSKPVAKIDAATKKLVEEMFETMYDAPGIGLAAIQIGEPRRIVTMDLAKKDEPREPQVFINPEVVEEMFEAMYAAPGIGLAAIQIGEPKRVVTMDLAKKEEEKAPQVFINPELVWSSEEKRTHEEGCLSIPEYYEEVERPTQVKVRYMDIDGKTQEIEANGLLATVLQHEIDHLNGVLFIDHISKLKRDRVIKKFVKAAKRADD